MNFHEFTSKRPHHAPALSGVAEVVITFENVATFSSSEPGEGSEYIECIRWLSIQLP
jgi:hypothetical protein